MRKTTVALALGTAAALAPLAFSQHPAAPAPGPAVIHPDEKHLRNLRQLTFGGQNAEGYWSADGKKLIYQSAGQGVPCDQQFVLELLEAEKVLVVQGSGFNWPHPDHFRIVFLPNSDDLTEAISRIARFLDGYRRRHAR